MKTITLRQPWASFIADGFKTIETRTHARFACLKGQRIAIHAGRHFEANNWFRILDYLPHEAREHYRLAVLGEFPLGVVVCTALVADARWLRQRDFDSPVELETLCPWEGRFGLLLSQIKKLDPPIPARGSQGIWEWIQPLEAFPIHKEQRGERGKDDERGQRLL